MEAVALARSFVCMEFRASTKQRQQQPEIAVLLENWRIEYKQVNQEQ